MTRFVIENISRRGFLAGTAASAFVIAASLRPRRAARAQQKHGADAMPRGTQNNPAVFVAIDADGTVTITCHRSEMGQGVRTGIPLIVADELEADWARVKVAQAPGDEFKYGNQDTDGSRSTRHFLKPMRECGAAARLMLEEAAARRWSVPAGEVEARNHQVVHKPSGRALGYGELAADARALPVPGAIRLKDPAAFRYIGKGDVPGIDLVAMTTGRAVYGIDPALPGMKIAVIARPPVYGGRIAQLDDAAARAVPGVERIVRLDGTPAPSKFQPLGGVAVVARNTWAALQGREALRIVWNDGPHGTYDSKAYKAEMEETARRPGRIVRNEGEVEPALAQAARRLSAEYYVPHLAHATMEPPAALARVADGKCEVWACVQSPHEAREDVAQRLGLPFEAVTVNVTLLGGGFGRKSKADYAIEAALLARETGAPVKVIWTRDDDLQNGYYHAPSVQRIEAGVDANGKVTAWLHRSVLPTIASTFAPDPKEAMALELGMGLVDMPFAVPNLRAENGAATAHTRIGWFRSVINIPQGFATQSFAAELAHELGRDPKDYLLELIGEPRIVDPRRAGVALWNYGEDFDLYPIDTGRLRRVVELAAESAGWGRPLPPRHGRGIAVQRSFVTYVATVVEAAVDDKGQVSVPRVDVAVDCGFAVNPAGVRKQIEGACVMGLSLALKNEISYRDGRVQQANFNDYDIARIDKAPRETRVHIVPHGLDVPPGGVGEPGVPPFAPALCNAVFAATGKRIRRLPIADQLRT